MLKFLIRIYKTSPDIFFILLVYIFKWYTCNPALEDLDWGAFLFFPLIDFPPFPHLPPFPVAYKRYCYIILIYTISLLFYLFYLSKSKLLHKELYFLIWLDNLKQNWIMIFPYFINKQKKIVFINYNINFLEITIYI